MRFMKITNQSLLVLLIAFVAIGPFAFGFPDYFWQLLHFPVVLVVCMALWSLRIMGGGDAKMIAVMAPFFVMEDIDLILRLAAACALGAVTVHSIFRFTALHKLAPHWESWTAGKGNLRGLIPGLDIGFPKGFSFSMTLLFYLIFVAIYR